MKQRMAMWCLVVLCILMMPIRSSAQGADVVVFDSIDTTQMSFAKFIETQTAELGDEIVLEPGTSRAWGFVKVMMRTNATYSQYPMMSPEGFTHPITLNVYADASSARMHAPFATLTQVFPIPWRPEANPACLSGEAWMDANGVCRSGIEFEVVFDFQALRITLPEQFIYGISFNTSTSGYSPLGPPGPYDGLGVRWNRTGTILVGGDFSLERFFQNSRDATAYIDGGVDGVSVFRWNEVLTGEVISLRTPQVQFVTIASPPVPMSKEDCKHGGWKTLVDGDSRPFKNQGQCIHFVKRTSYTHHHKHGRDCGDPDERDDDDRRHD